MKSDKWFEKQEDEPNDKEYLKKKFRDETWKNFKMH